MGLRGVETCAVTFNGTSVPEMNVLRGIGHGNDVIRKIFEEQVRAFFYV
jgi:alkylation response protein AidB-like acyl-CoA dehydrogenase